LSFHSLPLRRISSCVVHYFRPPLLVEANRNMVLHSPNLLTVFGVPGFEEDVEDEAGYYE
jgi:hypothetical protein